jgi:hypothetical protein
MLMITYNVKYFFVLSAFFVEEPGPSVHTFEITSTGPTLIENVVYIIFGLDLLGFTDISGQD